MTVFVVYQIKYHAFPKNQAVFDEKSTFFVIFLVFRLISAVFVAY